jgi:hypothetical protein
MKINEILLKNLFLSPALIAGLSLLLVDRVEAQYTFGPEVQSTNTASITYDSGTGTFQYTDAANSTEDHAYLPLTGTASTFITTTNGWTASINVTISARSMTVASGKSSHVVMGLVVVSGNIGNDVVFIFSAQDNNTGGGDDQIYPDGWYGTAVRFGAQTNGVENVTTALGNSLPSSNGSVYLPLSGGTNALAGTESFSNVTGVLTLSYNASTSTVTGYYNGTPIGSYSLASWGSNPPLSLAVWGGSGSGVDVPVGTDTASNFFAGVAPQLAIVCSGANVILTWPTNAAGFTLQSTTNLTPPAVWTTVSPAPVVVNTNNAVTNAISGTEQFYRLSQ